ncbi:hypothetical protein PFICI_04821 [Pestalotiopsis fici W106-1]|uniref:NACHT domain-containing protein n=1 Tax=Pestalotiopsis fici (strain W106-1 / CGMCC3.15140) TaxID=1229662 RepID=W3XA60_PESFW|nr:uncharacterized protein PFICI_04821 [Pestalotiopsis fici W106-1]ETS82945.1 hypothetical protein PFICI_04821 [Pestalotiopsis fici W106-1]
MGPFALVLVVVLVCLLWSSLRIALSISQSQSSDKYPINESATKSPSPRSVRLVQVHPPRGKEIETDIDIIAVHGLDTRSPDTWIWKSKTGDVNWLADNFMLPSRVGSARIFTCDWPANLFEHAAYSQKMFDESARLLLAGIEAQLRQSAPAKTQARPILFVASCLGGIILMKALVMARFNHNNIKTAVRGIVFLATPFRGTSFRDVAALAEPGLRLWAFLRNERVSKLVKEVMPSRELEDLVGDFTTVCRVDGYVECMVTFYETGMSSLPRKIFPWLPDFLSQKKPIVEESSGSLEIIRDRRLPLSRTHVQMNKFPSPNDGDYGVVVGQIERILEKIREDRYHERADSHIKNQHYATQMLEIERISTKRVSVETCYINLAIIKQPAEGGTQPAEVSLRRQLKSTSREGHGRIKIADLFDKHKNGNNRGSSPRRILIRGQAGVGKSTLCKKFVHDFKEHGLWNALFDRILWIPLRNLKTLANRDCNLEGMFHQEYFSQLDDGEIIAKEFWKYLKASKYEKTLFILDGLDEVYKESGDGSMSKLLGSLLEMPALIVTSRPQISLPVQNFDLELETIGFYPDQIDSYVKTVFAEKPEKVKRLHSVLQQHKLLRDLVRIPIQLDALCYIWDTDESSVSIGSQLQTMTGIYQAIAGSLWTKDILALGKKNNNGDIIEKGELQNLPLRRIEDFVPDEVCLLEGLAFTGMAYDMINFTRTNSMETFDRFSHMNSKFSPDNVLQRTSFLRTSNPSANSPVYHFLHLTFQEYFAARYFVRQWQARKPLILKSDNYSESVECFLRLHKYDASYDIFWRFVAGLLSTNNQTFTLELFQLIGQEPLDLVGPVHQRLLMHCLSEVSGEAKEGAFITERKKLEDKFADWLNLEVIFTNEANYSKRSSQRHL